MKSAPIKVTIITVVYNAETSIAKTINSVVNQTVHPYEYLVIDGKSNDGTLAIVESYRDKIEKQQVALRIISENDFGIYDAMNKGAKLAQGEYILFLNSDDWLEPNAIQTFYDAYIITPFDLAYGSIRYMGKDRNILIKKSRLDTFVSSRNWNHPSSLVRKELYTENPFDLSYRVYADFHWFLKLRRRKNVRICILPPQKVISNFAVGGASINKDVSASLARAKEKYQAYRSNGYSRIYWLEAYGWEVMKFLFALRFS